MKSAVRDITVRSKMVAVPELKQYLHKDVKVELNGNRVVKGKLAGYDFFLNLTMDDCVEVKSSRGEDELVELGFCIIRGNTVINIEVI